MPGLGGTAAAFERGSQAMGERLKEKRERKEMLSDEDRKLKVNELFAREEAIGKIMPSLKEGTPEYQKYSQILDDINVAKNEIYHPIKNPGALQKDWHWLSGLVHKGKPTPPILSKTTEPGTPSATVVMPGQDVTLPPTTPPTVKLDPASGTTYDVGPMAGKIVSGMVKQGNIDVNHRVQVKNADGSGSSIFSVTIPLDKNGKAVPWEIAGKPNPAIANYALVPGMDVKGRFFTSDGKEPKGGSYKGTNGEERAAAYYNHTGQHLGIFTTADAANQYAGQTHAWTNDGTDKKVFTPSYGEQGNQPPQASAPVKFNTGQQTVTMPATAPSVSAVTPNVGAMDKPQRQRLERRDQAHKETLRDIAAAGLSPEQEAVVRSHTKATEQSLEMQSAMALYDQQNPEASKEDRDRYQTLKLEEVTGIKISNLVGKWQTQQGTMNGRKVALMKNERDGRWTYLDGSAVPEEFLRTFVPDATKAVKKVKDGTPVAIGGGKYAQIWVDPYDPQNQSKWAWTPVGPGRYQQTIKSQGQQIDPSGFVTKTLRTTGPANSVIYDVSKIGQKAEDYSGEESGTQGELATTSPTAPAPVAPRAARPAAPSTTPAAPSGDTPVTDPSVSRGTYQNPLPLDHGSIPYRDKPAGMSDLEWGSLKIGAEGLLNGALVKELGIKEAALPKVQALAEKYGWSPKGLFSPKDKLLIREAGTYLQSWRNSSSLRVIESLTSREKINNAIKAADEKGGFWSDQFTLMFGLSGAEQDFTQRFLQARGTVSGLTQLTRGGRTTEAGIKRLMSELPNPKITHDAKFAQMQLDRLLSEIDVAQKQGFVDSADPFSKSRVDVINRALQSVTPPSAAAPSAGPVKPQQQSAPNLKPGGVVWRTNPDGTKTEMRFKGGAKNVWANYEEVQSGTVTR